MNQIYKGRKYNIYSNLPLPKNLPKNTNKGYLYFIRIGAEEKRLFKIGTTNRPLDRMKEHCKYFNSEIFVLWVSPQVSKYTTLRIEDRQKKWWIENTNWEYLENDRFIIPQEVDNVAVTIKKDYPIFIG